MMLSEKQTGRQARRPPIGLFLLLGFLVVPLAEIAVLIEVGGWLGLGPTLALIVLTAVIGAWMLRRQGLAVLRRAQQQMSQGALPVAEVFEGFCLVIAGALLLTPGFLTDVVGALLLLPAARGFLYRRVRQRLEDEVLAGGAASGPRAQGQRPGEPQKPPPAADDVEFEEVDPGDMPAPRGSWNREP
jgi:UPF0716 protein FxsA